MLNMIPFSLFIVAYYKYGIMTATKALMYSTAGVYCFEWASKRKLKASEHFTNWFLFVMCTMTLLSNNPAFLVWKASIMYLLMPISFIVYRKFYQQSALKALLSEHLQQPSNQWETVEYGLGVLCLILSSLSLIIYYRFGEHSWIQFKMFAVVAMIVSFMISIYQLQKTNSHESI